MFIFNTNSNNNSIFSQDPTTEESVEAIKKGIEDIGLISWNSLRV